MALRPPPTSSAPRRAAAAPSCAQALPARASPGGPRSTSSSSRRRGSRRRPSDYLEGWPRRRARAPRAARTATTRVDPMFDPRRFAALRRVRVLGARDRHDQQRRLRREDHVGLHGGPGRRAARRRWATGSRGTDHRPAGGGLPAAAVRLPRAARTRCARPCRCGGPSRRGSGARTPPGAGAGGRARRHGAPLRYSFEAIDHLRRGPGGRGAVVGRLLRRRGDRAADDRLRELRRRHDRRGPRPILRHLEIPFDGAGPCRAPRMRRQSDDLSHEWVRALRAPRRARRRWRRGGRAPRPNILYLHSHDTGRYVQPYGSAVRDAAHPAAGRGGRRSSARRSAPPRRARRAAPACSPVSTRTPTGCWASRTAAGR